jgi:hypothetical protein
MGQDQGMRKDVISIQEEKTMEYFDTQEVLLELKGIITH